MTLWILIEGNDKEVNKTSQVITKSNLLSCFSRTFRAQQVHKRKGCAILFNSPVQKKKQFGLNHTGSALLLLHPGVNQGPPVCFLQPSEHNQPS